MERIDDALFQENERVAPNSSERQVWHAGDLPLSSGITLPDVKVAFQTWGKLTGNKDNAILVCHALSGDSNAAGWWERLIGPGKAIDTNSFFVIGTNALGGCQGTTGPASDAPDGNPYRMRFPFVTVQDMVKLQHRLVTYLGIKRLHAVIGGSMGGMQALEYSVSNPGSVRKVWMTASALTHSAMQIGFNEVARQAIMRDPRWQGGNYSPENPPVDGLAVARMVGHLSYLSEASFEQKFGRNPQAPHQEVAGLQDQFQVESYLNYQGDKFTHRFDPNSLLYLTKAIDCYHCKSLSGSDSEYLFTSFSSDWLYPSWQSQRALDLALQTGNIAKHCIIDVPWGHDSFLLDQGEQANHVRCFVNR
ncbi:MAG: homoserine O-acetyltransferase [Fimbriimonadaceae bacterium]|nr:homoserine O-acetyltransferase [Fimbriimonadaceae bacterium]